MQLLVMSRCHYLEEAKLISFRFDINIIAVFNVWKEKNKPTDYFYDSDIKQAGNGRLKRDDVMACIKSITIESYCIMQNENA